MKPLLLALLIVFAAVTVDGDKTVLPAGVEAAFRVPPTVDAGSAIVWLVDLENTKASEAKEVRLVLRGGAIDYRGKYLAELEEKLEETITIGPGLSKRVELRVPESTLSDWTAKTSTFEVTLFLEVIGTEDVWMSKGRTVVVTPDVLIRSSRSVVDVGDEVEIWAEFLNPLPRSLTGVTATISVSEGLSVDGGSVAKVDLKNVAPGEKISFQKTVKAVTCGLHSVTVVLASNQLANVFGEMEMQIGQK